MSEFIDAEVGDKVWSVLNGWGEVDDVLTFNMHPYPIIVEFDTRRATYTKGGRSDITSEYPELFWYEGKVNTPKPKPKPEIDWSKVPIGTKVRSVLGDYPCNPSHFVDREFLGYAPETEMPWWTTRSNENHRNATGIVRWNIMELHPDVEVQEEWYKK